MPNHTVWAEVMGAVVLVLGRIGLAVSNRKHTTLLIILREVIHVTVSTSHRAWALKTMMSILKISRLITRST